MRWIVASLVFINILAFIYFQLVPSSVSETAGGTEPTPVGGQAVQLLSEAAGERVPAPVETAAVPAVQKRPVCTLVGSFSKLLRAEYFIERLSALGLQAEIKNIVVASEPGYWLYLPPESSRKEALRRLAELQRRGFDSYVIPSGNLANGISLGIFSKRTSAESLGSEVAKQGYKPEIVDVPREKKEIWILLPQGEAGKLAAERWSELLSADEYLQKRQNFCADVAQT